MRYATFLTIELKHAFYTNGKSVDFRLIPSPECEKILVSHKMRWREALSAWKVLTPLSDETNQPTYPMDSGTQLRFYLQVADPAALRFTQFPEGLDLSEALRGEVFVHYQNTAGPLLTASVYHEVQHDTIQVSEPAAEEDFRLKGYPISGLTKSQIQIEGYSPGYNILRYEPGEKKVWINTLEFSRGHELRMKYLAIPVWAKQAFGLVDITVQQSSLLRHSYLLALENRSAKWRYYVAANKLVAGIQDNADGLEELKFEKPVDIPENDPIGIWLLRKFPDIPVLKLIESKIEVPFHESVSKDIRLLQQGNGKPLRLPVPSRNQSEVQIITHFS